MLSNATRWLIAHSDQTVVVARRASQFSADNPIVALDLDWHENGFAQAVVGAIAQHEPISNALIWLHEPDKVLPLILPALQGALVTVVVGSAMPERLHAPWARQTVLVRLGSVRDGAGRRWLTKEEICEGVIASLKDGQSRHVGEVGVR